MKGSLSSVCEGKKLIPLRHGYLQFQNHEKSYYLIHTNSEKIEKLGKSRTYTQKVTNITSIIEQIFYKIRFAFDKIWVWDMTNYEAI